MLICTWRHGDQVGTQEQKHFFPLGTKLHFQANSSKKKIIPLTTNMATPSRGFKQRKTTTKNPSLGGLVPGVIADSKLV